MICPYIQNLSYTEQKNIVDKDNPDFIGKYVLAQAWTNMQCQKEHCAVWDKSEERCRYNG